jgi:hypothetical protein
MRPRLKRLMPAMMLVVGLTATAPASASAQVVQGLQMGFGWFFPTGESGRAPGDVLLEDQNSLVFRVSDLTSFTVNGEWTIGFGKHIETGFGVGYQANTAHSYWRGYDVNGFPVTQDLRLRIVPITAIVRFLPFGKPGHVQPFVGVGAAALRWRYSETGQFLDEDANTFQANFVGTGTAPAFIFDYGVRIPLGGDVFAFSFEGQYQSAIGKPLPQPDFLTDRIDLSGNSIKFQFMVRF